MSFRLTEQQRALQAGVRDFCTERVSLDRVRALEGVGFDRELWRELAEMGVFHARLDEGQGGLEVGVVDAALIFEELGRVLAPGPLVWTHLAAGIVDGAASGETVVGGLDLTVERAEPFVIEHLSSLDAVLLLRDDGVFRVDPRSLDASPVALPLDPITPAHSIAKLPRGEQVRDAEAARELRRIGTVLSAALLLGIAEATHDMAVAYAKTREQFGRIIGSFQAIKHMLADSFVRQEVARASVFGAAATLEHPEVGDAEQAVSGAKVNAGEAAWKNARNCIQVHGGMGYTWEVPAHYFLKRAWVIASGFGTAEEHSDRLGESVGTQGASFDPGMG